MIVLRDYQNDAICKLRSNIASGTRNQIIGLPTGGGKTVIASFLMDECHKKGKRAVFVVDRISLVDQTSAMLDQYNISHGIIQAQHYRFRPWERIQVASIQTLSKRGWPETDLIVVDECHAMHKATLTRISKRDAVVIGLSATPFTRGLGRYYDAVVSVTTTNRLIESGHLVGFRIFAASEPDMTGAKVSAGEWTDHEAAERSMPIVGDAVAEYLKHGDSRKFIAFGANVAHCEEIQRQFMASGVITELYTYRTPDETRTAMVTEFRRPDSRIRGLVSVSALAKGFDVPDVGVIIMCRPLRSSLAEHIQILGRGLRSHLGKGDCIVLDHSGNCVRFWNRMRDFFEHGVRELDDGTVKQKQPAKPKDRKPVKCSRCCCVHDPAPSCPSCGFEYPKRACNIEHRAGGLRELLSSSTRIELTASIWPQIVGLAHEMGKDDKWAYANFKAMTGNFPAERFSETTPSEPTSEVRGKIKANFLRWLMSKKKEASHHGL